MNNKKRIYSIIDVELLNFTGYIIHFMNRDILEFNNYGVTASDITDFTDLLNVCIELRPDTNYYYSKLIVVENKNDLKIKLLNDFYEIIKCVLIKWGNGSAQYNKFEWANIRQKNDKELLVISRNAVSTASDYLSELSSVGLTQPMIDLLALDADDFELIIQNIDNATETRDLKVVERVSKYNELYLNLSKYCKIGKLIWYNRNFAYYKNYLISRAASPKRKKKQKTTENNEETVANG